MDQPISLQRLCLITLGSSTWQIPHLTLRIQELFPSTQSDFIKDKKFVENALSRHKLQGLAPRRSEANSIEQRTRFEVILPEILNEGDNRSEFILAAFGGCDYQRICFGTLFKRDYDGYKQLHSIHSLAKLQMNKIIKHLPSTLQRICEEALMEVGERIYHWHEYISMNLRCNVEVPDKFCWTPYGGLDESKYLEKWEQDEEFSRKKSYCYAAPMLYVLSCVYVREDFIKSHQDEMERILKIGLPSFELKNYDDKVYTLIALYLNFHIIKEEAIGVRDLNSSGYVIPPDKMLEMSVRASFHKLVYYFYGKLNNFDEQYIMNIARDSSIILSRYNNEDSYYLREKAGEITNFLINQISPERKNNFIQENAVSLFCGFLIFYPFNEIISDIIKDHLPVMSDSDYRYISIHIQRLLQDINYQGGPTIKSNHLYKIFKTIITCFSRDLRENIFTPRFIKNNFSVFDSNCLNLVLKDMDERLRLNIIKEVRWETVKLAADGNIERLREFIDYVLNSDREKNDYKKYLLEKIGRVWENVEFHKIDDVFNLFSMTDEEKYEVVLGYRGMTL